MKKKLSYEVCYDIEVEFTYLGLTDEGAHLFKVYRYFPDGLWDGSEDEVVATWEDGELSVEGYSEVPNEQEEAVILEMVQEIEGKIEK